MLSYNYPVIWHINFTHCKKLVKLELSTQGDLKIIASVNDCPVLDAIEVFTSDIELNLELKQCPLVQNIKLGCADVEKLLIADASNLSKFYIDINDTQ